VLEELACDPAGVAEDVVPEPLVVVPVEALLEAVVVAAPAWLTW
jgi:hypothetical protein